MATKKTAYLGLNDWVGADALRREEISENFKKIDDKSKNVDEQLADKANKNTNVFNKKTYGTYETASVLSAIANEDNPKPQVLGFPTVQSTSTYSDRDTVALYTSNRSTKPTVVVNSGTITYGATTVQVTGATVTNLDKVLPGMLIDTYHTPNRWTSIVDSVDVATQTITVKEGWYLLQTGGSATPSIPTNGTGFDVNRITKIWGINNNVFLYENDTTNTGVAEEVGLFNYKATQDLLGGIDVINYKTRSNYGFQVRQAGKEFEDINGFANGFIAYNSANAYVFNTQRGTNTLLRSYVQGDSQDKGFYMSAEGIMPKLRLIPYVYTNGTVKFHTPIVKIFILNKTVAEDFMLPSPVNRSGEMIWVLNVGSAKANLTSELGETFVTFNTNVVKLGLQPRTSAQFISDGSSWFTVSGSFDNSGGYIKQSGTATLLGNLNIDNGAATAIELGSQSVASSSFVDFHSSGNPTDYDARIIVTGGDTTAGNGDLALLGKSFKFKGSQVATIKTGTVAPTSVTPDFVGQDYIDTTAKIAYKACGTTSADWKQTTN